jgi:hypothetical protein
MLNKMALCMVGWWKAVGHTIRQKPVTVRRERSHDFRCKRIYLDSAEWKQKFSSETSFLT